MRRFSVIVGMILRSSRRTPSILTLAVIAVGPLVAQHREQTGGRSGEIDLAVSTLDLRPGQIVAEIGAGDARFSFRFAEVVGPEGRVYANELGEANASRIREAAAKRELANLIAVAGEVDQTNLPEGCCDAMVMRHVYHMLTQPEPMAKSFFKSLRPGGTLLILEGNPQPNRRNAQGVPANRAGMGIDPAIVIEELSAVGFEFDRRVPDWVGSDYALAFRKPRQPGALR
jgi:predicted methyltransferase